MSDPRELTIARDITLTFNSGISLTGDVVLLTRPDSYVPHHLMLTTPEGDIEHLSITYDRARLPRYAPQTDLLLKNYSEHSGLPAVLEASGIGVISDTVQIPPFGSEICAFRPLLASAAVNAALSEQAAAFDAVTADPEWGAMVDTALDVRDNLKQLLAVTAGIRTAPPSTATKPSTITG
ncbi:hypothetical protein [Nesterenkonia populi]|uniref:hypothetical protein n=1 Tax=Nesterenkonia populi TaxID=1591087 RepID=UPI0011BDCDF3|nr:hypothetical protein [Nesterenkonia populi]